MKMSGLLKGRNIRDESVEANLTGSLYLCCPEFFGVVVSLCIVWYTIHAKVLAFK